MNKEKEIETVTLMVRRYCRGVHGTRGEALCPVCNALLEYARERRDRCPPWGDMTAMRESKGTFWDRNAGRYDRFMRKDRAAYDEMYALIRPVVKAKTVLELATGTGLIAKHIVNAAAHIEATDASAEMILEAKRDNQSAKLHFSVQDMFRLPYADKSFDVVIVSNALHIVPQPEKALDEIRRVLKDGGVLIAPTFTHAGTARFRGKAKGSFS